MRRVLALFVAVALVLATAGVAFGGNGGSGGTAAGPRASGRVLVGEYGGGAIGWVSFDVHPSTVAHPGFGTFQFDGLKGGTYPVTTESVITAVGWYHEADCCGYPDVAIIYGHECLYYASGDYWCRDFTAGFYDGGPGTRHDFFRWGNQGEPLTEYWIGKGSLTVNLGP